jgi:hypothetical protein
VVFGVSDAEALPGFELDAMVIQGDGHWNSAGMHLWPSKSRVSIETQQWVRGESGPIRDSPVATRFLTPFQARGDTARPGASEREPE